jgi:ubiquinone/menaquinone biosynthesis C-methylase UbiE
MAKDLFSKQATDYAKWRPTYPGELIEYIVRQAPARQDAWDCATGNGQAAVLLAEYVEHVKATDLSEEQLKHARPHPRIQYSQGKAEQTTFPDASFDLVTVAQAYHWFDQQAFCSEVRRICRPDGVVAIWGYGLCKAARPDIDAHFRHFYFDVTDPYWDPGRRYIDEEYRTVYFELDELKVDRHFSILASWNIQQFRGYLNSWSAVQKYISVHGVNPVDAFISELRASWDDESVVDFEFPIFLRMGRV